MNERHTTSQTVKITALSVADAARMMASAYGRRITEDQVREIAERGGLVREDGTINLLEYAAYLVRETAHGSD